MPHNITANVEHAIVDVKIAIIPKYSHCPDSIADGLNELLRAEIGEGFIADYAFYNTESPLLVKSDNKPEEGELFNNVNAMKEALTSLISDVQATGGIIEFSDGLSAPAAAPTWTDLGTTILKAHCALEKEGIELRLNITEADYPSEEAEENL